MGSHWKKGRGKLGFMQPLLGDWVAEADSPMGLLRCRRRLEQILGGSYVQLEARWEMGSKRGVESANSSMKSRGPYEEVAIIGQGDEGKVSFWSFTSDGKRSQGTLTDATDIHEAAIGFEAKMPAGLARMIYWPDDDEGFFWAVESKTAKGWKRFVNHHYTRVAD